VKEVALVQREGKAIKQVAHFDMTFLMTSQVSGVLQWLRFGLLRGKHKKPPDPDRKTSLALVLLFFK
jgi:hypothetical protein